MVDYSGYRALTVQKSDGIAVVTLNRPEVLNAFDGVMHVELVSIWRDLAYDGEVHAIVLTGAGRAFSAGGDLNFLEHASFELERRLIRESVDILDNMLNVEQPIIAAVNGVAVGGGLTIALYSDIIIAAESARFGDTHVPMGMVAGDGGAAALPLLVGLHRAKELLMTGDIIDAREAERIGLVNRVVPDAELMPTAISFARRLANGPTWATRWTKTSLNRWLKFATNFIVPGSLSLEMLTFNTEDRQERIRAFLEKREPDLQGR